VISVHVLRDGDLPVEGSLGRVTVHAASNGSPLPFGGIHRAAACLGLPFTTWCCVGDLHGCERSVCTSRPHRRVDGVGDGHLGRLLLLKPVLYRKDRTGGRYRPSADAWTTTSIGANVPYYRSGHSAVCTGAEIIVWGSGNSNTGGRYDPSANGWAPTSAGADPHRRALATRRCGRARR
jgi:hypothetical protein